MIDIKTVKYEKMCEKFEKYMDVYISILEIKINKIIKHYEKLDITH